MQYEKEHVHPLAVMSLVGGAFHNLLDGLIIGASFLVSIPVGIAITTAVIFHKIPKEMGWFGVLVHGGFTKAKAIIFNYISSLFTIIGAAIAIMLSNFVTNIQFFIIPIAIGGFIYLAGSNLIPELHKEFGLRKSFLQLITILLGMLVMASLLWLIYGGCPLQHRLDQDGRVVHWCTPAELCARTKRALLFLLAALGLAVYPFWPLVSSSAIVPKPLISSAAFRPFSKSFAPKKPTFSASIEITPPDVTPYKPMRNATPVIFETVPSNNNSINGNVMFVRTHITIVASNAKSNLFQGLLSSFNAIFI